MEFFKKYQVIEHSDGSWSVVRVEDVSIMGAQQRASINVASYGFSTAAEAQELADDLNEEHGYESTSN